VGRVDWGHSRAAHSAPPTVLCVTHDRSPSASIRPEGIASPPSAATQRHESSTTPMTSACPCPSHDDELSWRQADDGLWVATARGEYAGMAAGDDARLEVFDHHSRPLGWAGGRAEAALLLCRAPASPRPGPGSDRARGRRRGRGQRRRTRDQASMPTARRMITPSVIC